MKTTFAHPDQIWGPGNEDRREHAERDHGETIIERQILARYEHNYASGATAMVQQEIALTQRSIYHRPSHPTSMWDEAMNRRHPMSSVDRADFEADGFDPDDDWASNFGKPTIVTMAEPTDQSPDEVRHPGLTSNTRRITNTIWSK